MFSIVGISYIYVKTLYFLLSHVRFYAKYITFVVTPPKRFMRGFRSIWSGVGDPYRNLWVIDPTTYWQSYLDLKLHSLWPFAKKCVMEFLFILCLGKCSLNFMWKVLLVWPTYYLGQSEHPSLHTAAYSGLFIIISTGSRRVVWIIKKVL